MIKLFLFLWFILSFFFPYLLSGVYVGTCSQFFNFLSCISFISVIWLFLLHLFQKDHLIILPINIFFLMIYVPTFLILFNFSFLWHFWNVSSLFWLLFSVYYFLLQAISYYFFSSLYLLSVPISPRHSCHIVSQMCFDYWIRSESQCLSIKPFCIWFLTYFISCYIKALFCSRTVFLPQGYNLSFQVLHPCLLSLNA